MTKQQVASILLQMHPKSEPNLDSYNLQESEKRQEKERLTALFNEGIANLNTNQLKNLLDLAKEHPEDIERMKKKLALYQIDEHYHTNILEFIKFYSSGGTAIDVGDLEERFQGVQVASRDNFNTIITQGYTGDWDLNPDNVPAPRVQVASMNEGGMHPRGYYLNATITEISPITKDGKTRYRIFFSDPIIVNTGNRNVTFTANPVRYKY